MQNMQNVKCYETSQNGKKLQNKRNKNLSKTVKNCIKWYKAGQKRQIHSRKNIVTFFVNSPNNMVILAHP